MVQDWKGEHFNSQRDTNDSICNSIFFHLDRLPSIIPLFSLIAFNITVPERGFHSQNRKALVATMAAE